MSTAAATLATPAKKGLPKIAIILGATLLVLAAGGGGAYYWMNTQHAGDDEVEEVAHSKRKDAPSFMPLEIFTVNLADKESDRFLQVGVTFELTEAKGADAIKPFVPAVRNAILMVIAHKESRELLERAGKEKLAAEIRTETLRAMGYDVSEVEDDEDDADDAKASKKKKKKKKAKAARDVGPVRQVHFASFIIN